MIRKLRKFGTSMLTRCAGEPPLLFRASMLSGVTLLLLMGVVAWQKRQIFWLDEAMLLIAIQEVHSWLQLFGPLPAYDQASPPGFALFSWLVAAAPVALSWQKLLPSIASFATVMLVGLAAKRSNGSLTAAVLAVTLLLLHGEFVLQFCYFKHYIFEIFVSSLAVFGLVGGRRSFALIAASFGLALVFTNITPMLVIGIGAASVVDRRPKLVALAFATGLLFSLYYFTTLRAAVGPQMLNYSHIYEQGFAASATDIFRIWRRVGLALMPTPDAGPFTLLVQGGMGLLLALGLFRGIADRHPVAIGFTAIWAFLSVAAATRLYPWLPGRYSIYLLPFVIHLIVSGLTSLAAIPRKTFPSAVIPGLRYGSAAALALLTLLAGISFYSRSVVHLRQGEVPVEHIAVAAQSADIIVPIFIGQPQVELAVLEFGRKTPPIVNVHRETSEAADLRRIRSDPRGYKAPGSWPLLLKIEQSHLGLLEMQLPVDNYTGWIVRQAEAADRIALILPTCFPHLSGEILGQLRVRYARRGMVTLHKTPCFETLLVVRREDALTDYGLDRASSMSPENSG